MLVITTNTVEGKTIEKYLGLVTGEAIMGINVFRDMLAGVRDVFGGRSRTYEKSLQEGRDVAVREMSERAGQMGANAVIGVNIDYETVGGKGSMLMVNACGTAVVLN